MIKDRLTNITLFSGILISLLPLSLVRIKPDVSEEFTAESDMILQSEPSVAVRLDVPLLNQLDPTGPAARLRSHGPCHDPAVQRNTGHEKRAR